MECYEWLKIRHLDSKGNKEDLKSRIIYYMKQQNGNSKLQVSEEYQELIRVMVWHNRYRVKQGLNYFSPAEFESFLKLEMPQDFDDLGIEIDDFLSDLIKIRNVEQTSFDIFNKFFKDHLPQIKHSTSAPATSSSEKKTAHQDTPDKPTPSTNLLHKFATVANENKEPNSTIDKPIILKN
jgi:hypothetical protein